MLNAWQPGHAITSATPILALLHCIGVSGEGESYSLIAAKLESRNCMIVGDLQQRAFGELKQLILALSLPTPPLQTNEEPPGSSNHVAGTFEAHRWALLRPGIASDLPHVRARKTTVRSALRPREVSANLASRGMSRAIRYVEILREISGRLR